MPSPSTTHNQPEYSVSEVSGALKRVVEDTFGHVRVRGELSGFKRAASGHCYMDLKDDKAVLNGVCWKGVAARLSFQPEDGLEVICTGKISTYPGRSNYQIIIDAMEPAGEGALMALLEKRKKELAKEGLFDPATKQALPYLPARIGVVTSPTGAVIRDILHRIEERFPVHVQVWPVRVQGEGAAEEIAAAIRGFNAMPEATRPELLIVARGGGSLEDLWCFNEECVVRAAAGSLIPLISAVGHETDTTLIDYASDKRAPTPTAAAEIAVPVRADLLAWTRETEARLYRAVQRLLTQQRDKVQGLERGLPKPAALIAQHTQHLDGWAERLNTSLPVLLERKQQRLLSASLSPHILNRYIAHLDQKLYHIAACTQHPLTALLARQKHRLEGLSQMLSPKLIYSRIEHLHASSLLYHQQMQQQMRHRLDLQTGRLKESGRMLASLNYHNVLKRGYAIVKTPDGHVVTQATQAAQHPSLLLEFQDGQHKVGAKPAPRTTEKATKPEQESLF